MPNLIKLLCDDLRKSRTAFPLVVGMVLSTAPLYDAVRGWHPWPDLLYQAMTAYLVVQTIRRVRKAIQQPEKSLNG